jgi:hypothetical protein
MVEHAAHIRSVKGSSPLAAKIPEKIAGDKEGPVARLAFFRAGTTHGNEGFRRPEDEGTVYGAIESHAKKKPATGCTSTPAGTH